MKIISTIYSAFLSVISKVFWLLGLLLFLRLLLKFLNANPETLVVDWIYSGSNIFVSPFYLIFQNIPWRGFTIDTATFSAIIGYAILFSILFKIFHLFEKD